MTDLRDDRIAHRRRRRNSEAVSRLCRSWMRAGSDTFSDLLRIAADAAQDFGDDDRSRGPARDRRGR